MSLPQPSVSVEFSVDDDVEGSWDEPRLAALVSAIVLRDYSNGAADPHPRLMVSLYLVSDETMRQLNATHRGRDTPTDVLSFPLQTAEHDEFVLPPGQAVSLGDVVVSYARAAEQAREFGHSLDRELAYLVAHGTLHVLGYDHETEPEQTLMRRQEEEALQPLGFTR
jgi:probable rRNA maturation factor